MDGLSKKEVLFKHFSANLTLNFPQFKGAFVCPLCRQLYSDATSLDLAHIFPKSLGGNETTLTCRKCNNRIGSEIESHEARRIEDLKSDRLRMRLSADGVEGDIGVDFWLTQAEGEPTTMNFQELEKVSNPTASEGIKALFEQGFDNRKLHLHYREKHDWKRGRLTYLHFGFLYLFHQLGYQWALSPIGDRVREQLSKPLEEIYKPLILEVPDHVEKKREVSRAGFSVVYAPDDLVGFLVTTPKIDYESDRLGILFPINHEHPYTVPSENQFLGTTISANEIIKMHDRLATPGAEHSVTFVIKNVLGLAKRNED